MSKAMVANIEELADFHGETVEDTIRLLIHYGHADMRRFVEEEFGKSREKIPPREPQPDDEIPL